MEFEEDLQNDEKPSSSDSKPKIEAEKNCPETEKIWQCDKCQNSYATRYELKLHKYDSHIVKRGKKNLTGENQPRIFKEKVDSEYWSCDKCNVVFPSKYELTLHKRENHLAANLKLDGLCPHCGEVKHYSWGPSINDIRFFGVIFDPPSPLSPIFLLF